MRAPTLVTLHWPTEAECAASATRLAAALRADAGLHDAFIELHGPLGAGKTTFVRHLLHALGVQGRVKSPTYAVVEEYEIDTPINAPSAAPNDSPWHIWHFDFYRFDDPQEWEDAGFRDVFASAGLKLAEWPEKAEELLPPADLRIDIDAPVDLPRVVRFTALSERALVALSALELLK